MKTLLQKWSSKKFQAFVLGLVFYTAGASLGKFGWEEAVNAIWKIVLAYFAAEGGTDAVRAFRS